MSADPEGATGERKAQQQGQASEEELRAAYEAELSRVTSTDMMAQAAVSLLNIGARRLGPPAGAPGAGTAQQGGAAAARDLEQVRDSIDAVKALLEILERRIPGELRSLRDALSQLQMAYAREVGAGGGEAKPAAAAPGGAGTPPAGGRAAAGDQGAGRPAGPAESSGRLWVPGR